MNLSRIFWASVMLLRAKGKLRSAIDNTRYYEASLKNDRANLDYYLREQPKRRMDVIMAEIEYDASIGRERHAITTPKGT